MVDFCVTVPFPSAELATMVFRTLNVDTELREDLVSRHYRVDGSSFVATFRGANPKLVRTCVGSFFDMLMLAVRTLDRFGSQQLRQ